MKVGCRGSKLSLAQVDLVEDHYGAPLDRVIICLLYTSPSPRDATLSGMPW
mgnify:CR=1 FL=1